MDGLKIGDVSGLAVADREDAMVQDRSVQTDQLPILAQGGVIDPVHGDRPEDVAIVDGGARGRGVEHPVSEDDSDARKLTRVLNAMGGGGEKVLGHQEAGAEGAVRLIDESFAFTES